MTANSLTKTLQALKLNSHDIICMHGNLAISSQVDARRGCDKVLTFFNELKRYFSQGAIFSPSFTYSVLSGSIFDVNNTESETGQFSEYFRKHFAISRTSHPVFSFSGVGKFADCFDSYNSLDCFGENSIFDGFFEADIKLVFFGCSFNSATFVHYVEQREKVKYRYFKYYNCQSYERSRQITKKVRYFVRKLSMVRSADLDILKKSLLEKGLMREENFGRLRVFTVLCSDFYREAKILLLKNPYILIERVSK